MAILNLALLALSLPAALARPWDEAHSQHARLHTGTGRPHRSLGTGAPFPVGNSTATGPTGTGTGVSVSTSSSNGGGPVYITSTVDVVPQPVTTIGYYSNSPSNSPGSNGGNGGNSGSNSPGQQGSGGSGSAGSAGGNGANSVCGPATVTVTSAQTVYVTVGASAPANSGAGSPAGPGGNGGSKGPIKPSKSKGPGAPSASNLPPSSVPPFPLPSGNSSVAGTGTGTAPVVVSPPSSSSTPAPAPVNSPTVKPAPQPVSSQAPYSAPASVPAPAPSSQPQPGPSPIGPSPVGPGSASSPVSPASSAPAQSSSSSSSGSTGPKGVIYNNGAQARSMDVSWACNWGQVSDVTNPPWEYVPQLWGPKNNFAGTIAANAANAKNVLFYNEPDIPTSEGGSGVDVGQAVADFNSYMVGLRSSGKKVSSPCVANSNSQYLDTFLGSVPKGSVDILCFHWYGPEIEGLKSTVATFKALATKYNIPEVWLTEMAVQPTPSDLSSFTNYLDTAVDRYAYNLNDLNGMTL